MKRETDGIPTWIRYKGVLLLAVALATGTAAQAADLEVLAPRSGDRSVLALDEHEVGELEITLKSLGDMVGGYRLIVLDDEGRQVGKNISDANGVVRFTGLPAGRFRVLVERKLNERGGMSTVEVGQISLSKRLRTAAEERAAAPPPKE